MRLVEHFWVAACVQGLFLLCFGASQTASAQSSVTIHWNNTAQTIDGFGTAQPADDPSSTLPDEWDHAWMLRNWPSAQQPNPGPILDLAFSTQGSGIGLTIFRSKILPSMSPSPGVFDNTVDPNQVWLMQQIVQRGPVKLMGTVWSPPAHMKTNNRTSSGVCSNNNQVLCRRDENCSSGATCLPGSAELRLDKYQDFANFLQHYTTQFAQQHGLNIYAISFANEPDTEQTWDSCKWTSAHIRDFLKNNISANMPVQIVAPETSAWDGTLGAEKFLESTYNDAVARDRLNIAAAHTYYGSWWNPFPKAQLYNKRVWQTESSLKFPTDTIDGALTWAWLIHEQLALANVSAWLWWVLAYTWNPEDGTLIWLKPNGTFEPKKAFWALGQFSKFVRPGFIRMTTASAPANVAVSAYRDPITDQFVIVVLNANYSSVPINIGVPDFWTSEVTPYVTSATQNLQQQTVTYLQNTQTLPARSIVSYVSRTRNFNLWANAPNAKAVAGDFNGDGKADIALVGGDGWSTIPVALSLGNGTFSIKNHSRPDFALVANAPGAQVVAGDLNRDGRDDLVVSGGPGWTTIPVAFSNGDGSFYTTNYANASLAVSAQAQGAKLLAGDINNDGRDDLVLTGGSGWTTVPVGFSNGNGTFNVTNLTVSSFPTWAQDPYAKASITDINADGRADIVLTSGTGWTTIPIALSNGNGSFTVVNQTVPNMPVWSQAPGAHTLAGCRRTVPLWDHPEWHHCNFNGGVGGDQRGDIALTGGDAWWTIPVGFGNGNGTFQVTNSTHTAFATLSQDPNVKIVSGDFDGGGRADIALIGGHQWWTVPMAFSFGNGLFSVTNYPID